MAHVKRGKLETSKESAIREEDVIESLKEESQYKLLGVLEKVNQEDNLVLQKAEKVYVDRLSVIRIDYQRYGPYQNKVLATNQSVWTIVDLQRLDRETRKVMVVNGAKHPLRSTDVLYLPRMLGGRGLKAIKREYKIM